MTGDLHDIHVYGAARSDGCDMFGCGCCAGNCTCDVDDLLTRVRAEIETLMVPPGIRAPKNLEYLLKRFRADFPATAELYDRTTPPPTTEKG